MYYTYILWSSKSKDFYFGYTDNLKIRFKEHNSGLVKSTKTHRPWKLVFYASLKKRGQSPQIDLLKLASATGYRTIFLIWQKIDQN